MRSIAERMSLIKAGLLVAFAAGMASLPVGCSDDKLPNAGYDNDGGGGFGGVATGPCDDGASRKCGIKLGAHENVTTCYEGNQVCVDGEWGPCTDGEVVNRSNPGSSSNGGPGSQAQALGPPGPCANNPCDPYCLDYDEQPDGSVTLEGGAPIYNWQGGLLSGYPQGLVKKGLNQPCQSGADCQFNTECVNPLTAPPCGHSKCMPGGGLNPGCDPCVSEICAVDPSCCTPQFGSACWHSPCTQGSKLKSSCDPCVAQVCAAKPSCCNTKWDSSCVNMVTSVCGKTCSPGNWTQSCVDKVATVCDAKCGAPAPSTCAHSACVVGSKLDLTCNLCVAQICSVDPYCCTTTWDSVCVGEVTTECGLTCPINMDKPPPETGQCVDWKPGQTDPACPGVDLAVDATCTNTIPVCNHGQATAPAGIRLVHFPANSSQYPLCNPDQTHPQMEECFTTQPIPPGQCTTELQYWNGSAWVAGCDKLVGNREIMINPQVQTAKPKPPGYAGHVTECSCKDNWSLYSGGTCTPPVCVGDTMEGALRKVHMYITLDRSGSMAGTKWTATQQALKAFFQAPSSAGLNIAFEAWATAAGTVGGIAHDGCGQASCNSSLCANPIVPDGALMAAAAPTDAQEQKLVSVINALTPGGWTPSYPAAEGGLLWAQSQFLSNPNDIYVMVFVTDGDPTTCTVWPDTNVAIQGLASAAYQAYGIRTYAIGMEGANIAALNAIAAAGGSGSAFVIVGSNISGVAQQLIDALNAIASENVGCDLTLPAAGTFDPADTQVIYTESNSNVVNLAKYGSQAACGSNEGWYFDDNASPTKIILCPASCTKAKGDPGSKIEFNVGCPKQPGSGTTTQTYQATCPAGSKPQWGFFAYDTTTPGSSTVTFDARTATTQAGLASATYKAIATAQSTPNTQVCPLTGPSPCPKDLYTILGIPDAQQQWLELKIGMNGTGGTPVLNSWQITYSCPPAE